jgi:RNA polymerase sigma-70 factor, ECF subfamily
MEKYSEKELIVLIKEGNIFAFEELYRRNWRGLYDLAKKAINSSDEAKDFVQDVFINFWNSRDHIDPERYSSSYLVNSLKNSLINFFKKDLLKKKKMLELAKAEATTFSNEDNYIASELLERLNNLINDLPKKMQRIFVLSRHENLSISEISRELNIAPRTVKNQLSNALKILRARIGIF